MPGSRRIHCFVMPRALVPEVSDFARRYLGGDCRIEDSRRNLVILRIPRGADALLFRLLFRQHVVCELHLVETARALETCASGGAGQFTPAPR